MKAEKVTHRLYKQLIRLLKEERLNIWAQNLLPFNNNSCTACANNKILYNLDSHIWRVRIH